MCFGFAHLVRSADHASIVGERAMQRRMHVRRNSKRLRQCCVAIAAIFGTVAQAYAANKFWDNTAGGNFSTSANWQSCGFLCNPVPGSNDVAHFGLSDPGSLFQF